jgi:competence protein ComEC
LPFAAGILCYDAGLFVLPASVLVGGVSFIFLLYAGVVFSRKNYRGLTFTLQIVIMFAFGLGISYFNNVRRDKSWFGNKMSENSSYLARVTDAPAEKENSWKVSVRMISSINEGKVSAISGDAFLYLHKDNVPMRLHKGDTILVPGKWVPIKNAGNPFEFDYAAYCRRNGIYYQQSCSPGNVRLYATGEPGDASLASRAHDWCMQQLDHYITEPKTKGLIQAMLLGDEVNLDEDLRQSYSETGIIHIIAISGGNVTIFFVAISGLLWWLRHKKHLWVKYAIALPLVWFYVIMAGAPPSAVRAAIMFSLLALSVILQKSYNGPNQLLATAFLLLCAQPMWLFSVGFQLSFVAVLSLILFYKPVYKWLSPVNKIAKLLWGTIAASISAEILAAPLVIYYFHMFPLLFIVANALAYLFMSFVLFAAMGVIVLSWFPLVAKFIGVCIVWTVTVFDKIVVWLQSLNPVSFHFLVLTGIELILVYLVIAGFSAFLMRKQKPALFTAMAACSMLLVSLCTDELTRTHQQRLVVYNTKSNHAELIAGNRYTVLTKDTASSKKISYATTTAHINWRAWQQIGSAANEITYINGKSFLILNREIDTSTHFPVDYLFINYAGQPDPQELKKVFSPSLIIVGNNYKPKQRTQFIKDATNAGIAVYALADSGAFILQ